MQAAHLSLLSHDPRVANPRRGAQGVVDARDGAGRVGEASHPADAAGEPTAHPLLALDPDLGKEDVPAVAEELLVVQFAGLPCATAGETFFTGSPLRWASACASWKSSFEPSSTGF